MDVSVIVPLYNGGKYITKIVSMIEKNKNILRLQGQEVEVELVFINDSPNEKVELQITKGISFYENQTNLGIHASRVNGLKYAMGEYILFLDQDDEITNDYILSQLQHIGNADAVICNGYYRDNKLIYNSYIIPVINRETVFSSKNLIVSPGQVLIRKKSIPNEWLWRLMRNSGADDFLLWLLMAANDKSFVINPEVLYTHVEGSENASLDWSGMVRSLKEMLSYVLQNENVKDIEKEKIKESVDKSVYKMNGYARLDEKWKLLSKEGRSIGEYIKYKQVKKVAIYGYGMIGQRVVSELQKDAISVEYIVDQDDNYQRANIPVYNTTNNLPDVELLIVTPLFAYQEIKKKMQSQGIEQIISIEELIEKLLD